MRSSTVKVHIKTHPEAENARVIKLSKEFLENEKKEKTKEEEKVQPIPIVKPKPAPERVIDRIPSFSKPKEEIVKRPENRVFKQRMVPPMYHPQPSLEGLVPKRPLNSVVQNKMRRPYSNFATIDSSLDIGFAPVICRPSRQPNVRKKILVALPNVSLLNKSCLIKKPDILSSGNKILN